MNKKLLLLIIILILAMLAVNLKENIKKDCKIDEDCYISCYGCISKDSFILKSDECYKPQLLCRCIRNTCQYQLSKSQAIQKADEIYPEIEKEASLEECEENPCWKVNFTIGETKIEIIIDSGSGEIIQEYCDGEECNIISCDYSWVETTPRGEIWYYNMGCDNPLPTCDMNTKICRACQSLQDCLRKNSTSVIFLDIGQILTHYEYKLIGTDISASYDESSQECIILKGEIELYSSIITMTQCEQTILSYIQCDGECKIK